MSKPNSFWRREDGGITLEAALTLPFFLTFVLALQALIQLSLAELSLRSAVSETAKLTATSLYPVQLLYAEAKTRIGQTKTAAAIGDVLDKLMAARDRVEQTENQAEQWARFIPDPVLELLRLEKRKREEMEEAGIDQWEKVKKATFDAAVNRAFTEAAYALAGKSRINKAGFRVTQVEFPDLDDRTNAYFTISAEYDVTLRIPFWRKTVTLREQAKERAWLK